MHKQNKTIKIKKLKWVLEIFVDYLEETKN